MYSKINLKKLARILSKEGGGTHKYEREVERLGGGMEIYTANSNSRKRNEKKMSDEQPLSGDKKSERFPELVRTESANSSPSLVTTGCVSGEARVLKDGGGAKGSHEQRNGRKRGLGTGSGS